MLGNAGVWGSFGYRETENELLQQQNSGYPVSETLYLHSKNEKNTGNANIHRPTRLEQQKERVFAATVERRLDRRQQLNRDLLRGYDKDYVESVLRKDYLLDVGVPDIDQDQFNIKKYYHKFEPNKYANTDDETNSLFNYSSKRVVKKRTRPKSAIIGILRTPRNKLLTRSEKYNTKDKIPRIRSDPEQCNNLLNPVAVKHAWYFSAEEKRRHSNTGCEHCPVECRPVSNSSYRPTSSTGLQANSGPNHYQYFHYDRYIKNQRPHSAIGQRKSFLEKSAKFHEAVTPIKFTNIVRSCEFHTNPRSGSPTRSQDGVKEAWTDHNEDKLILDTPIPLDTQGTLIDKYDDDIQNDSVREQAELTYKAITSDNIILLDIPAEEVTRAPTPTPTLSRAESFQSHKSDERNSTPIINQGFDMLTGQIYGESEEVEEKFVDAKTPEEKDSSTNEAGASTFEIKVDIQSPVPLPIKRIAVERVDIIDPEEAIDQEDTDNEKEDNVEKPNKDGEDISTFAAVAQPHQFGKTDQKEVKENYDEDDGILPQADYTEFDSDSTVDARSPRSILKVDKEGGSPIESSPIRVTFKTKPSIANNDDSESVLNGNKNIEEIKDGSATVQVPSYNDYDKHARKENKTTSKLQENKFAGKISNNTALIFSTPSQNQIVKEKPVEPERPFYEEPSDENLKRLLSNPDLGDFVTPEFPDAPKKAKKKTSKSGGKKKKGKKKKKKKTAVKKPEAPAEPLFEYDPNALDVVEMTKRRIANQRRDNDDLISAINTMKLFDDACKEKYKKHYSSGKMAAWKQHAEASKAKLASARFSFRTEDIFTGSQKTKNKPWLFGRMALSKQICRFWLPMDLRELIDLTPCQYIFKYCVTCKRRTKFYAQSFDRNMQRRRTKEPQTEITKTTLSIKETTFALKDVHANCISDYDIEQLYTLLCIDDKENLCSVSRVNCGLFVSMCSLAERLFYENFVTEDAEDLESSHRKRIELADFDNLTWRLRDVNIHDELRDLLFSL